MCKCTPNMLTPFCVPRQPPQPIPGAILLREVPEGAQLITCGDQLVLVAPGQPVSFVTPAGLVPIFGQQPMKAGV